jgi:hypothetical protein
MTRAVKALLVAAVVLCVAVSRGAAELPPDVYKADQAKSPEAVTITVTRVGIQKTKESRGTRSSIAAEAKVVKVQRSASNLRVGDKVRISYSHFRSDQPIAGPSEPDVLEKDRTYPAFLQKTATGDYAPAARGYSFRLAK